MRTFTASAFIQPAKQGELKTNLWVAGQQTSRAHHLGPATSSGDEASNDILEVFECVLCFFVELVAMAFCQRKIRDLASGQDLGLYFDCDVALGNA